ncbi:exfoliative toxin A [Staphylococcus microti]|uniref:Exfoliative toxin A n=1 Tax=Staphylococcus microti TaxID=569857 RepID=A0A380I513_9STAP|nr:exfoliative toxin A [Staphylococcus microti]
MPLKKVPLVISGLILGLLGLGNLLKDFSLFLCAICGGLAIIVFLHLLYSMVIDFNSVKEQLKNPLVSSVFTTFLCLVF